MKKAEGGSKGIQRWLKRQQRRLSGKMLGIGDGANDVAMIQAADVGIGIMGKEGRQVTLTSSINPFSSVKNVDCSHPHAFDKPIFLFGKCWLQISGGLLHRVSWYVCCSDTLVYLAQDELVKNG